MTTIKHYCDKCGQLITENRTLLVVKAGPLRQRRGELDFCLGCVEGLGEWMGPEPGRKPETTRSSKAVPQPTSRATIR